MHGHVPYPSIIRYKSRDCCIPGRLVGRPEIPELKPCCQKRQILFKLQKLWQQSLLSDSCQLASLQQALGLCIVPCPQVCIRTTNLVAIVVRMVPPIWTFFWIKQKRSMSCMSTVNLSSPVRWRFIIWFNKIRALIYPSEIDIKWTRYLAVHNAFSKGILL
jgi:hypothetical protein